MEEPKDELVMVLVFSKTAVEIVIQNKISLDGMWGAAQETITRFVILARWQHCFHWRLQSCQSQSLRSSIARFFVLRAI